MELEKLYEMEYPGRVIIIGKDRKGKKDIVIYAVTGRSPSSQARKIKTGEKGIWVKPTDEDAVKKGNIDLLIYPAILYGRGITVSNGKQTSDIIKYTGKEQNPIIALSRALQKWEYEPDEPTFTPRISGCLFGKDKAALSILKRGFLGESIKNYFEFPLIEGKGKMIATYQGENRDPLPSFPGDPLDVELKETTAEAMAESVYKALSPKQGTKDFRVSVVCLLSENPQSDSHVIFIINRYERDRKI